VLHNLRELAVQFIPLLPSLYRYLLIFSLTRDYTTRKEVKEEGRKKEGSKEQENKMDECIIV